MDGTTIRLQADRLIAAICRAGGVDPAVVAGVGFTIVGEADRAGTRLASAYQLGPHLVVRCDPDIVELCHGLLGSTDDSTLDGFEQALPDSAERLGRGWIHLIEPGVAAADDRVRLLDPVEDLELIRTLVTDDPEGADEAEIDLDALDEHMVGVVVDGVLAAYASERRWVTDAAFSDIGVTTHPAHRRRGLGAAVVATITARVFDLEGLQPMYRCNWVNAPSKALADRVGYVAVASLTAAIL